MSSSSKSLAGTRRQPKITSLLNIRVVPIGEQHTQSTATFSNSEAESGLETSARVNSPSSIAAQSSRVNDRQCKQDCKTTSSPSTPRIVNPRKRKRSKQRQSPYAPTTPRRGSRQPLSSLEVTPEATSVWSYLLLTPRRPRAMPARLRWANGDDIWARLVSLGGTSGAANVSRVLKRNPAFKPHMRAILLDWLIEVCEVYDLHRDTYYLAMNILDRYLNATENQPKEQLQLVGVACLFIAGKMEEIYPPNIHEYSYVSDGACTEREIIAKELAILTVLKWNIAPVTANNWLTLFLQLSQIHDGMCKVDREDEIVGTPKRSTVFHNPSLLSHVSQNGSTDLTPQGKSSSWRRQFVATSSMSVSPAAVLVRSVANSPMTTVAAAATSLAESSFVSGEDLSRKGVVLDKTINEDLPVDKCFSTTEHQKTDDILRAGVCVQEFNVCAQLLDLCTLDMQSVQFSPLHLAAAVVNHALGAEEMERVSGLRPTESAVAECYRWMRPFASAIRELSPSKHGRSSKANFNKQVHNVDLPLLERAQQLEQKLLAMEEEMAGFSGTCKAGSFSPMAAGPLQGASCMAVDQFHALDSSYDDTSYLSTTPTSTRKRMRLLPPNVLMTPPSCVKILRSSSETRNCTLDENSDHKHSPF